MMRTLRGLEGFGRFWAAHTVSVLGTNTGLIVIPLLALNVAGASVFQMGLLEAAESLAVLFFGLFIGRVADEMGGDRSIIAANLLRALLLITIPVAYVLGSVSFIHIFLVVFALGAASLLYESAMSTIVVRRFPKKAWPQVNSAVEGSNSVTEVAGPGIGGLLVQAVGAPLAVLLDVCTYLVSSFLFFLGRGAGSSRTEDSGESSGGALSGLRLVWQDKGLRAIFLSAAHFNFFAAGFSAVLTYYMVRDLGFSSALVGLASVGSGIFGVVATLVTSRLMARYPTPLLYFLSYALAGVFALLVPVAFVVEGTAVRFLLVSLGLAGWAFAIVVNLVMSETIKQHNTPETMIGQVSSAIRWGTLGVVPFGAVAGGYLGGTIGSTACLIVMCFGLIAAVTWLFIGGDMRKVDIRTLG
ncbi:MFS transporter [Corynebacterium lowii]|uniref:Enterobactin exporter EntS n=1 Tax=Corynebacterium lowii TaxID=1544413 RepID=A0A0N8W0B1_9CORY|nr:MFS transporter [Corynebacterium lowii]KQB86202.1 enterobactin exporter EntS [Corynebacterium lowii]MDP9852676.1 MFS family permease [Corynebacterium lowii]